MWYTGNTSANVVCDVSDICFTYILHKTVWVPSSMQCYLTSWPLYSFVGLNWHVVGRLVGWPCGFSLLVDWLATWCWLIGWPCGVFSLLYCWFHPSLPCSPVIVVINA